MKIGKILTLFGILISSLGYAQEVQILFVGNSLTYYNNLPELVKEEAKILDVAIEYDMIAKPNYALIDHLDDGEIQTLLSKKKYNYVIVQQGPSSQAEGRGMLINDGKKIADLCNDNGAQLCFFMVWPSLNYYSSFDGVIESYSLAAKKNEAILLPVGNEWKAHFDQTKSYDYYGPDGFHPSRKGSMAAADIIITTLFRTEAKK